VVFAQICKVSPEQVLVSLAGLSGTLVLDLRVYFLLSILGCDAPVH
jgi:hypothetical protein